MIRYYSGSEAGALLSQPLRDVSRSDDPMLVFRLTAFFRACDESIVKILQLKLPIIRALESHADPDEEFLLVSADEF